MSRILALTNQKGGVGKTTTAINVGAYLANQGHDVLLIDLDPQANATSGLGADRSKASPSIYNVLVQDLPLAQAVRSSRPHFDLVPSAPALAGAEVELVGLAQREYRLQHALTEFPNLYEYVLIDCPPSLGLLTINALTAADGVIVPVQCEYLALEGLSRLLAIIDLVRRNLNPKLRLGGLVLTMFDPRINLAQQVVNEVRSHFPNAFQTIVPRNVRLSEAPSHGLSIFEYDPTSRGALAYGALAEEILARG